MKIFKFGGASIKDANAVKNVASILKKYSNQKITIVVSAMGKTTNALEKVVETFFYGNSNSMEYLNDVKKYHYGIIEELFPNKNHTIYTDIHNTFVELEWAIEGSPTHSYECEYDQIVSLGEILSSKIVSHYLNDVGIKNKWLDVRDVLKTDDTFREAKVDWMLTEKLIKETIVDSKSNLLITQGFIGITSDNFNTTLGREGSDYTGAILAYCTDAESVTIWKDVPGVLNADPKFFKDSILLEHISYQDAVELAYYGASVIHPKTIKPLQNKNIPLYVKSFINADSKGTVINNQLSSLPAPCYIFKKEQILISFYPKDFSFIVEENLSDIFKIFAEQRVKINTMQNSAVSFSVCIDHEKNKVELLLGLLRDKYKVLYNENVELVTIRYYNQQIIDQITAQRKILLEVKSRYNVQLVLQ